MAKKINKNYIKYLLLTLLISFLIFLNAFVIPSLKKKKILNIVQSILTDWKNGDLAGPMSLWKDANEYPPVNNLMAFQIKEKIFYKENFHPCAKFTVTLDFSQDHFPTGKEWIFELKKTALGWRVTDFYIVE